MLSVMRKHALSEVWCNPEQDRQFIIKPARVTRPSGVYGGVRLMGQQIPLPKPKSKFHVFQVGQLTPSMLGMLNNDPAWLSVEWKFFPDVMASQKMFVNIYDENGVQLPRFRAWYMFTRSRSLIVAIEEDSNIPFDYRHGRVFINVYTNAFFASARSSSKEDIVVSSGATVTRVEEILNMQNKIASYRSAGGYVFCYRNGMTIGDISPITCGVGDTLEYVYDNSVKRVVKIPVTSMSGFMSTLDKMSKYLIHYPDNGTYEIDFFDDVTFQISRLVSPGKQVGLYVPKNHPSAVRMVTHHDYSIDTDLVKKITSRHNELTGRTDPTMDPFVLELYVRENGYQRSLIYDANRIFELYKLPDAEIVAAMTDGRAAMPFWRAEALENSAYTALMGMFDENITAKLIEDAYGYNGISKILADTPVKPRQSVGWPVMDVPMGLYEKSTAYEYDATGKLIGSYPHAIGTEYMCVNERTKLVEMVSGVGSHAPTVRTGRTSIQVSDYHGWRVYMTTVDPTNNYVGSKWTDITDSGYYKVENGVLTWTAGESNQFLMVRFDDSFLDYELNITPIAGTIYFSLSEMSDFGNGAQHRVMPIPPGELDIWLNGRALVRDVDYVMIFPKIYIWNKKFVAQPGASTNQKIHVRARGFPTKLLDIDPIEERGWVEHGALSRNKHYDLRDDRVLRIIVGGATYHRDDLHFDETDATVRVSDSLNGLPYEIKDLVVPLKDLSTQGTYVLRDRARVIDKQVQTFMQDRMSLPTFTAKSAIAERYPVVAPFMTRLINDMISNQFSVNVNRVLSDNEIVEICKPYESLMDFDPINGDVKVDLDYVIVLPHFLDKTLEVKAFQFAFLQRVNKLYYQDRIPLNNFLTISA